MVGAFITTCYFSSDIFKYLIMVEGDPRLSKAMLAKQKYRQVLAKWKGPKHGPSNGLFINCLETSLLKWRERLNIGKPTKK